MDVNIRKAEEDDAELLAKEFWHPLAEEMEKYHEINELRSKVEENAVAEFEDRLEDDKYEFFFLEVDGEEVGYVSLEKGERESREIGDYVAVIGLFVKEGFRGEGYGTKLIGKAKSYAENVGADYITVSAEWENEKARDFYLENGFEEKKVKFVQILEG
jgi:GNAT superfamily N-acetyltransferase